LNVFTLFGGHIETFFNELKIDLKDHEKINPFTVNMAEIKAYPFYELNEFDNLRLAKEGQIPQEFKKMKEALKTHDAEEEDKKPLAFFATLTAFNFHAGSNDSIQFLKALGKKAAELNQLFLSKTIQNVLLHKF
jgi:hypothetical protein